MDSETNDQLTHWEWREAPVDTSREHIKLTIGDASAPVALIQPAARGIFNVEILIKYDENDSYSSVSINSIIGELNFYLVDKREIRPWQYAIYHCSTAANVYSMIHWGYYPNGDPQNS